MDYEPNKQRVWIELEVPVLRLAGRPLTQAEQATPNNIVTSLGEEQTLMKARAKLASNMLRKCGVEGEDRFFVMNEGTEANPEFAYYQNVGGGMISRMNDHGAWCNLGFLGRED